MKKILERCLSLLLASVMLFAALSVGGVSAAEDASPLAAADAESCIKQMIAYYRDYGKAAVTDIERLLRELKTVDVQAAALWSEIMGYWIYANSDMQVNVDTIPSDLPEDGSLCIVVLGYALNSNGTMRQELLDRLAIALQAAEKYPSAYVAVTGGGTAANAPEVTEAKAMGDWLLSNGLAQERLILEDKAPDTIGNAKNTFEVLNENFSDVRSILMVTSDYHVRRGSVLFHTQGQISAYESGSDPVQVIDNASNKTTNTTNDFSLQVTGVCSIADLHGTSSVKPGSLSQLIGLQVTRTGASSCTVNARYDSDYIRDVSDFAEIQADGETLTVRYTENEVTVTAILAAGETDVEVGDNTYLKNLVEKAEGMSLSAYTKTSAAKVTAALEKAKAVLENAAASEQQVSAAYEELDAAVRQLVTLPNLAEGKNVTANCNQAEAAKITNGKISSSDYWSSYENGKNIPSAEAEAVIDLDGQYHVDCVRVYPYCYGSNKRIYKYELYGSTDGQSWEKIGENLSDAYASEEGFDHEIGKDIAYLKLKGVSTKVEGRSDINNIHIREIQAFGEEKEVGNLALGKPITDSGGTNRTYVVDGDRVSYWDAGKYENRPWVTVDLGALYDLGKINVINYWKSSGRYYRFEVAVSVDGETFTTVYEKTDNSVSTKMGSSAVFETPVCARYVKVTGTYNSSNSAFHVNELRAYGEPHVHSGGTASCTEAAVCTICGETYGTCGSHTLTETAAVAPTHEAGGSIAYWTCSVCGKLFGDADAAGEISAEDIPLPKLAHSYGEYVSDADGHWQECECGSTTEKAPHSFGEWTVTKEPTAAEKGSRERSCADCGYTETEELPALSTGVLLGDVNGDGRVNVLDRVAFSRWFAGWDGYDEEHLNLSAEAADFDGDGKVTASDRVVFARYFAGWAGYETLPVTR